MSRLTHKHRSILFFLLFFTPNVLLSMSSYEYKVWNINKKYYSIFKYGYEVPLSREDNAALTFWGDAIVKLAGLSYSVTNYPEGELLYAMYEEELEAARSLMTEKERIKEWEKSCYGGIIRDIKNMILKQVPKDQFETYQEYYDRTFAAVKMNFDKLCLQLLMEMYCTMEISIEPNKYNAETQTYVLKIKQKFYAFKEKQDVTFGVTIKCSSEKAKKIYALGDDGIVLKARELENIHWGVVSNEIILLSSFSFNIDSNTNIEIVNKDKKLQPLYFPFNLIDNGNFHLKDYQFCCDDKIGYMKDTEIDIRKFILAYQCYLPALDTSEWIHFYMGEDSLRMEVMNKLIPCQKVDTLYAINKNLFNDYDEFLDCAKKNPEKPLEQEILARKLYIDNRNLFNSKDEIMPYVIDSTYINQIEKRQKANREYEDKYFPYFRDKSEYDYNIKKCDFCLERFEENVIKPINREIEEYYNGLKHNYEVFPSLETYKQFVLSKSYYMSYYKDNIYTAQSLCEEYFGLLSTSIELGCRFRNCEKDKPSKEQQNAKCLLDFAFRKIVKKIDGSFSRFFEKWCTLDKEMNKEYMKNGNLFVNEKDFFFAYISADYKQLLKYKKNKTK